MHWIWPEQTKYRKKLSRTSAGFKIVNKWATFPINKQFQLVLRACSFFCHIQGFRNNGSLLHFTNGQRLFRPCPLTIGNLLCFLFYNIFNTWNNNVSLFRRWGRRLPFGCSKQTRLIHTLHSMVKGQISLLRNGWYFNNGIYIPKYEGIKSVCLHKIYLKLDRLACVFWVRASPCSLPQTLSVWFYVCNWHILFTILITGNYCAYIKVIKNTVRTWFHVYAWQKKTIFSQYWVTFLFLLHVFIPPHWSSDEYIPHFFMFLCKIQWIWLIHTISIKVRIKNWKSIKIPT